MITKIKILLLSCLLAMPIAVLAQNVPVPPDFDDYVYDVEVPFDGGVSLLVAAGVGYGLIKAREKRNAAKKDGVIK